LKGLADAVRAFGADWAGGVPFTVLIDTSGQVLYKTQGGMQPLEVRRAILKALPDDQYVGQHAYWNSPVIAKGGMHHGRIHTWHVTGNAVFLTNRTSPARQVGKILRIFRGRMTAQTCFIVGARICRQRLVGIIASHTRQSGVAILSPALTLLQSIRLHSEGLNSLGYAEDVPKAP
jgi:hypothetical protein